MKLIDKDTLVAEIEKLKYVIMPYPTMAEKVAYRDGIEDTIKIVIKSLEVKEVDLIVHTIIAECCDWLAMNTNLSHDEIENCRNLMLNVKEEQYKAQKGEEV